MASEIAFFTSAQWTEKLATAKREAVEAFVKAVDDRTTADHVHVDPYVRLVYALQAELARIMEAK